MNLFNNFFSKKEDPIHSYQDFWNWFQTHEKTFFKVVKKHNNIEKDFFDKISPKLNELKDSFSFLTGMFDDNTVELVLTADGTIMNLVFVEELVKAAPSIKGWKFTALKPAIPIENVSIEMDDYTFNKENIFFYSNEHSEYPDEIDITIVHNDFSNDNQATIINGSYIFLDNYLGELDFATTIDHLTFCRKEEASKELVPIHKLKDFLIWREKEFIEKYEGKRYQTEEEGYSGLEAELKNGMPLIAIINTDLLEWDSKASHPWVMIVEIKYDGENKNGMPNEDDYNLLKEIESEILNELKDTEGYLYIGRQTAENVREIYFACNDFRKPSTVLYKLQKSYANKIEMTYDIFKDKYWQSFNRFQG